MFGIYIVSQRKSMSSLFLANAHDGWDSYSSPPAPHVSEELATEHAGCLMLFRCGSWEASRSVTALVALGSVGPYLGPMPRDWR